MWQNGIYLSRFYTAARIWYDEIQQIYLWFYSLYNGLASI